MLTSVPPTADRDDLADHYEAQKEDQLKSTKEGKAKWKGELASNSEASVRRFFPLRRRRLCGPG